MSIVKNQYCKKALKCYNHVIKKRYQFYILALLVSLIFIEIITRVFNSFIDFDEGYFLVVARHIHANLQFASNTKLFDPLISTGPTVLFPAALLMNFDNPLFPRLIMVIYSLALIFLALKYIFNSFKQRLIFLTVLFLSPLYFFFSSHILGELPAFVFYLGSLIFYQKKRYFYSGLFLALAILTKNVYFFGIFGHLFFYLAEEVKRNGSFLAIRHKTRGKDKFKLPLIFKNKLLFKLLRGSFTKIKYFIIGIIVPIFTWELFHLTSFSFNFFSYLNSVFEFHNYAYDFAGKPNPADIASRINMFEYVFLINGYLFLLIVLFILCLVIYKYYLKNLLVSALAFFGLVYLIYFLFIDRGAIYRHFMLVTLTLSTVTPFFLEVFLKMLSRNKLWLLVLFVTVIFINIYTSWVTGSYNLFKNLRLTQQGLIFYNEGYLPKMKPDPLLVSQLKTAEFIKQNIPSDKTLTGTGWWSAHEISYLSGRKIEADPFAFNDSYFITDIYAEIFGSRELEKMRSYLDQKIFETEGKYAVYKMRMSLSR